MGDRLPKLNVCVHDPSRPRFLLPNEDKVENEAEERNDKVQCSELGPVAMHVDWSGFAVGLQWSNSLQRMWQWGGWTLLRFALFLFAQMGVFQDARGGSRKGGWCGVRGFSHLK